MSWDIYNFLLNISNISENKRWQINNLTLSNEYTYAFHTTLSTFLCIWNFSWHKIPIKSFSNITTVQLSNSGNYHHFSTARLICNSHSKFGNGPQLPLVPTFGFQNPVPSHILQLAATQFLEQFLGLSLHLTVLISSTVSRLPLLLHLSDRVLMIRFLYYRILAGLLTTYTVVAFSVWLRRRYQTSVCPLTGDVDIGHW